MQLQKSYQSPNPQGRKNSIKKTQKGKEKSLKLYTSGKAIRQARGLLRVTSLLAGAYTQQKVAKIIINEGFSILGAKNGDIALLQKDQSFKVLAHKGYAKTFLQKIKDFGENTPLLTQHVIETRKPYFIENVALLDEKYKVAKLFITTSGARAAALLPLNVKNSILGVMQFTFEEEHTFSREDIIFMTTLANQCAQAFERVIALEKLQESKKQLEVILKNTADGIIAQNAIGEIIYINTIGASLFGYSDARKLQNLSFKEIVKNFIITDEFGKIVDPIHVPDISLLKSRKEYHVLLNFMHKKTEKSYWLLLKSTALYNKSEHLHIVITTIQDMTQMKELDQQKDSFISMASHELKTPLTSMKLMSDVLFKKLKKQRDDSSILYLGKVQDQIMKLQKLIIDLLDVSRIQKGKLKFEKEYFCLNELLEAIVEEFQLYDSKNQITLKMNEPLYINGDKIRLYQVISNLITNAMKYSPEEKKIVVSLMRKDEHVVVSVKDNGIGIAREYHKKIFDRFYQVVEQKESTYAGLGMGLYISVEVIKHHGGNLWVDSQKGKGSTFSFTLPLVKRRKNKK